MLRIGICDENTKDRAVVRQIVTDTLFREEELSYIEYAEAETLEQEIQANTVPFDLLLMEMNYKNKSGLQLAKQIRAKNLDVDLLFVTEEADYVYEGYHVQAQGYVLKEDMKTQLPDCLRQYMKRRAQAGTILVKSESVVRSIPIAVIRYIESRARVLLIHTQNEVIPFYGKLADIEHKVLQHGFVRIHQSFLVRKAAIAAINGYEAVVGEDTLPISRKYYKTVQIQFQLKQKIQVAEEDIDPTVTRSLAKSMEDNGAIIGTKGELLGIIYRMKKGEGLTIGRDAGKCQIVLKNSNVSRAHCVVRRLADDTYEVEDCSKNGVYVEGVYLGKGKMVQAEAGNRVWLCDESQEFRLG